MHYQFPSFLPNFPLSVNDPILMDDALKGIPDAKISQSQIVFFEVNTKSAKQTYVNTGCWYILS